MAKNCKHCTEQGKNLKPVKHKNHIFQMNSVVEPIEEVQLDFAGPLPDELNKDAYILDAIGKWSKFQTAKVVSITTADVAIKFMQRYISKNGVPLRLRCDQAQTFTAKKFQLFRHTYHIKLLFAPGDDHRAIGVVERIIQTLKRQLGVMRIDPAKTPYKLASDVAKIVKTLRITPHGVTKITKTKTSQLARDIGQGGKPLRSLVARTTTNEEENSSQQKEAEEDTPEEDKPDKPSHTTGT